MVDVLHLVYAEIASYMQGRIHTKLGLMLLPRQGPIFFSAFKTDQDPCDATTLY